MKDDVDNMFFISCRGPKPNLNKVVSLECNFLFLCGGTQL